MMALVEKRRVLKIKKMYSDQYAIKSKMIKSPYCTKLDLTGCWKVDDNVLHDVVTYLPNLKKLVLAACHKVSDQGIDKVSRLKQLEILDLSKCYLINDISVKFLNRLSNLKKLYLNNCANITDYGVRYLSNIPIKVLCLTGCGEITGIHLSTISSLTNLNLSCCQGLKDSSFTNFYQLLCLEEINLSYNSSLTDQVLHCLGPCYQLKIIKIIGMKRINGSGFSSVTHVKKIVADECHEIHVSTVKWNNHISNPCPQWEEMCLNKCNNVTDKCFDNFNKDCIKVLQLIGCPNVSQNCVDRLRSDGVIVIKSEDNLKEHMLIKNKIVSLKYGFT